MGMTPEMARVMAGHIRKNHMQGFTDPGANANRDLLATHLEQWAADAEPKRESAEVEPECCGNCRAWKPGEKTPDVGECRKHSKQVVHWSDYSASGNGEVMNQSCWEWPAMKADEWCGEHEAKTKGTGNANT